MRETESMIQRAIRPSGLSVWPITRGMGERVMRKKKNPAEALLSPLSLAITRPAIAMAIPTDSREMILAAQGFCPQNWKKILRILMYIQRVKNPQPNSPPCGPANKVVGQPCSTHLIVACAK